MDLVGDLFSAISFLGFGFLVLVPGKEDLDLVLDPVLVVLDLGFGLDLKLLDLDLALDPVQIVLDLGFGLDLHLLDQFFSTIDFVGFGNLSLGNLGISTLQEFWTLQNLNQSFSIIDFLGFLGKEVLISCVFGLLGIHESL